LFLNISAIFLNHPNLVMLEVVKMKHDFWGLCAGIGIAVFGILLVLTSSSTSWLKIQYVAACILLGMAVCYVGDRI
jgi:hypothetical protein